MNKIEETKSKKCDYCDEYAIIKVKEEGIYLYLCKTCAKDIDKAKESINTKN